MSETRATTCRAVQVTIDGKLWISHGTCGTNTKWDWVDASGNSPDAEASAKLDKWVWGLMKEWFAKAEGRLPKKYWDEILSGRG